MEEEGFVWELFVKVVVDVVLKLKFYWVEVVDEEVLLSKNGSE